MISISNLLAALVMQIAADTNLFDTPIEVTTAENQVYTAADNARFKSKGKTTVLKGNTSAARLSERSDREAIVTKDKLGPMDVTYTTYAYRLPMNTPQQAPSVLYLRGMVTLTNPTRQNINLNRLTIFKDAELDPNRVYSVVGNTDGAVICGVSKSGNPVQWIAVEHPMAKYDLKRNSADEMPRTFTQKENYSIGDLTNGSDGKGVFYVPVKTDAAIMTVTVQYTGGNLKAVIYGVEAIDPKSGKIIAKEIKTGETGDSSKNNTYTLKGRAPNKDLVLKITAGTDGSGSSNGKIILAGASHKSSVTLSPKSAKGDKDKTPDTLTAYVPVVDVLRPGESMTFSYVIGYCQDAKQFRRAFSTYLNNERAHPYRVLPHYNNWYDHGINRNDLPVEKRFTREEALSSMRAFRKELWEKRGVFINSYLWDDGWDNFDSLWGFNANFPNGFKELADEAHLVPGASIGTWMSPFGGYGGSFSRRLNYAKRMGFIDRDAPGMQLSKPKYYAAFRDRILQMIKDYDMNLFKFDRMGSGSDANGAADRYAADLRAVGNLCGEMRAAKQDVFINCTVGTWASPYWLMWCDSIWKGHNDCDSLGRAGTARQRWVTYRDNVIHDRFVAQSPLFPLNSLMMHGILVCKSSPHNTMRDYRGTGNFMYKGEGYATPTACADFASEVWMGVALGTGLQEYYITPQFMSETWWDILAKGVKWIKANESTLMDSHWIGGDPGEGTHYGNTRGPAKDIYGYAALGKKKGIVILRNPSDKAQSYKLVLDDVLEMPGAAKASKFKPTVIFNSSAEYENVNSPNAFKPLWPRNTAHEVDWVLPPFATILFEVAF